MQLVFLGAPGVGKGTQADKEAAQYGVMKISTGDLLREAVRNQTKLGLEAKGYMDQGRLVPDSVVIGLVRDKLTDPRYTKGFILDGFPRTVPQAEALGKVLDEQGIRLNRVINFRVTREDVERHASSERLQDRAVARFPAVSIDDLADARLFRHIVEIHACHVVSGRRFACDGGCPFRERKRPRR